MFSLNATRNNWQWIGAVLIAVLGQGLVLDGAGAEPLKTMDETSPAVYLAQEGRPGPELMSASLSDDGIHAYGEAMQRDQLMQDYLVFAVDDGQVQGVIYRPQSEYACFTGRVTADALEMAIAVPDQPTPSSYAIAVEQLPVEVAGTVQRRTTLDGYHAFSTISEAERSLLEACTNQ